MAVTEQGDALFFALFQRGKLLVPGIIQCTLGVLVFFDSGFGGGGFFLAACQRLLLLLVFSKLKRVFALLVFQFILNSMSTPAQCGRR